MELLGIWRTEARELKHRNSHDPCTERPIKTYFKMLSNAFSQFPHPNPYCYFESFSVGVTCITEGSFPSCFSMLGSKPQQKITVRPKEKGVSLCVAVVMVPQADVDVVTCYFPRGGKLGHLSGQSALDGGRLSRHTPRDHQAHC